MRKPLTTGFILLSALMLTAASPDYTHRTNWVLFPEAGSEKTTDFDVFYIYPTLVHNDQKPLMDWSDAKVAAKTLRFSKAQTSLFGKKARIFAPYVRQLEFGRAKTYLENTDADFNRGPMRVAADDTIAAMRYYLKNCRNGRPFILFGHSQGAMNLYSALRDMKEISPENGFVAAYLPGLPRVTRQKFAAAFSGRNINLAAKADDLGVVIVWNTQNSEASNPMFVTAGTCAINPLNWRTDAEPASARDNIESIFYDYKLDKFTRVGHFCGARLEPQTGALIVALPSHSDYDAHAFMGRGVFHMNDVCFFAGNIAANAEQRVQAYLKKFSRGAKK